MIVYGPRKRLNAVRDAEGGCPVSDDLDEIIRQAETAAATGEMLITMRTQIHEMVEAWPNDGLLLLARAIVLARGQLPEDMIEEWER
jgi:hypothetical protein